MKNYFLLLVLAIPLFTQAQEKKIDPVAILILDHMSDVIGEMESCSFTVATSQDVIDIDHGLIKVNQQDEVLLSGPNKMLVHINGDKGKKGYWYNGEQLVYYSYTENNYGIIDAPATTMATIDSVHASYGIYFPAADFFYPANTDDMMEDFDSIEFLGRKTIDQVDCLHIKASNASMDVQFWIENDAFKLPKKYVIIYKDNNNYQYEAVFNNWKVNPLIPDAVFEFTPPAQASLVKILAKN